jgi:hypothetical protein
MSRRRWNANALAVWSVPLLLILLIASLATPNSHSPRTSPTSFFRIDNTQNPLSTTDQNVIAGNLTITNPQLMVPVPHAGRWFLDSSNSLSAELVCSELRLTINKVFVEPANERCQVVLVALHLPTETSWKLASA